MSTKDNVTIIGAGAWGTTLALVADRAGNRVTLVAHRADVARELRNNRRHPTSLPGVRLPESIVISSSEYADLIGTSVVVLAIPVQQLRVAVAAWQRRLPAVPIISVAKGLDTTTLQRPTEIIAAEFGPQAELAALSGPNLAGEIANGQPATTLIASATPGLAERLVPIFHGPAFRVYHGNDVVGLELGGALKNIIAIGAGMAEGLGAGDNAKAALMTRGLAEISRLGVACGANALTFTGISGMGDLIATCASSLSRNHRVGLGLAAGRSLPEVLQELGETAEGVPTTLAARQLARQHEVDTPIIEQMAAVLFDGTPVESAIDILLSRRPTGEL
ncbi:MAG TPA: NAD(P)H-dependent glycerol-3-phosphate dehydrogenase [Thermomicrobiales bacterium]|nr:NAD(P)H-dependent glycerol-3-phosphate dehydrogenase [Thermomicrobiales bacterium]